MSARALSIYRWVMVATLFCMWLPCHAQFSAVVQGTVTDPKGAIVQGASVTLTNTATNIGDTVTTNGTGGYHFENLLPADYQIVVAATGFEKAVVNRHVSTDEVAGVNITLTVGRASASVEVTTAEHGLNPDETRIEYTLTSQDITNIPLPDNSTVTSFRVAPGLVGTIEATGGGNITIGNTNGEAAPDARANGRPASSNVYLLDRIPITSTENTGNLNMIPNPDMLSEIALQTTTFSVENGATSSLQVDMTSKAGGNKYHGDLNIDYSSKPFEANPDFSAGVSPFHRRFFMGSIGGPIIKDHTFFFGAFERVDVLTASGAQATAFSAPGIGAWTTAQYASPLPGWNTAGQPWSTLFNYAASGLVDQTTSSTADTYYPNPSYDGGTQFGNKFGVMCATATSPQTSSYQLPCDTPITVTGLFNQSPGLTGQQYNLRFDHSFNGDNDKLYFGYFGVQQNSAYIDPRPDFNTTTPSQSYYFSAGYSHIFTPKVINQFNAGLNRYWGGGAGNPNYTIYPHGTYFGFLSDLGGFAGGPQESPDSPYIGADAKEHVLALRDYVSWLKGSHSFRFGFQNNVRNYWNNDSAVYSRPYGMWFSDILEMMQGEADQYSLYTIGACGLSAAGSNCAAGAGKWISQVYGAQQTQFAGYAQDDWKIKPNLNVTYGIRWDDFGNPSEYGDNAVAYANTFLGTGSNLYDQVSNVYGQVVSKAFTSGQTWNFLPRAAFSWEPGFTKNLVVRGGIGLYQDAINLNQITANLPTSTPIRLTLNLYDNAEPYGSCFFCGPGQWQGTGSTGTSGVAGEPGPFAITGTQGTSAPFGFPYPSIPVTGQLANGLSTGPGGVPYNANLYGVNPKLKPQSTFIWNFGVEQELPDQIVVGATYTGSYSYNQFYQSSSYNNPPGSSSSGGTLSGIASTTDPAPAVGSIQLIENGLTSNYNAMILTAQQRKGTLSWQANYLWSHALGEQPFNPFSPYGYGNLPLDTKQRFTFSGTYEVPGAKAGLMRAATHGWTLGAIFIAQEGTPFTVFTSQNVLGDGLKDGNTDLPSVVFQPGSMLHYGGYSHSQYTQATGIFGGACGGAGSSGNFYDPVNYPNCPFQTVTTANANPKTDEGNEAFNAFRNPGYQDLDLNLQKKTELPWFSGQKSNLILRAEAMNSFNRANLQGFGPSVVLGSATDFGQVQGASNPRIIQIGARFEF